MDYGPVILELTRHLNMIVDHMNDLTDKVYDLRGRVAELERGINNGDSGEV